MKLSKSILSLFLCFISTGIMAMQRDDFEDVVRPLLEENCYSCHRTGKPKGGVNLKKYKEQGRVIKDGQLWLKVLEQIKTRQMPPDTEPPLSLSTYNALVEGINGILQKALEQNNPGQMVIRRLSHTEYTYTIQDLLGVTFEAGSFFPSDGSGGGGFDNQAGALFMTPLKLERYYEAASIIADRLYNDQLLWKEVVPFTYRITWWQQLANWFKSLFSKTYQPVNPPDLAASKVIVPIATKAFRRFLKTEEKHKLSLLFQQVYHQKEAIENPQRFEESILETLKAILVSPNFLYRVEEESERTTPYQVSDFELASRLSYFLWSSMPDQELFLLASKERLHDTTILQTQVRRMLKHPKARRFAETFSSQWLGIQSLTEQKPVVDPEKFPEFKPSIRKALYEETVAYFYHVLTGSKNFLELINGNYTFLNEELADYYDLPPLTGDTLRKVTLTNQNRGGILGMGSVLTVT